MFCLCFPFTGLWGQLADRGRADLNAVRNTSIVLPCCIPTYNKATRLELGHIHMPRIQGFDRAKVKSIIEQIQVMLQALVKELMITGAFPNTPVPFGRPSK